MKKSHRTFYLGYLFAITCNAFGQAASTDDIVQKLLTESSQEKIVREAVTRFNPDTVEVLFERFSKVSDVDRRKQLAFDFLLGGVPDNRYFDLLQSWARTAVNDQAPTIYVYDAQGEAIRGTVSADFQNWCFDANLKLSDCSKTRLLDYYL